VECITVISFTLIPHSNAYA